MKILWKKNNGLSVPMRRKQRLGQWKRPRSLCLDTDAIGSGRRFNKSPHHAGPR